MGGDTDDDANYDIGHADTDTNTDGQLNGCPPYNCNVVIDGDDGDDDDENTAAVAADDVDDAGDVDEDDDADIDVNATAVAYYDAAQVCVQHQPLQPLLAERSGSSSSWFFSLKNLKLSFSLIRRGFFRKT